MDNKIFLKEFDNKKSVNTSEGLNIPLMGKRRLLPTNDFGEVISQNDVYMDERKGCNKIRLTCQVNPICSNVLFNRITEIVRDEGSSAVTYINYGVGAETVSDKIMYKSSNMEFWSGNSMKYVTKSYNVDEPSTGFNRSDIIEETSQTRIGFSSKSEIDRSKHPTNSIRDTQISNDNYVYHCGLDIFNNHLIRSNTFKTVCKCNSEIKNYDAFNTIADIMRDSNGYNVIEALPFPVSANVPYNAKLIPMHLYEYDDLYSFDECVEKRLNESYNGWCGFYNRSKIKSYKDFPTSDELEIERPIMYENGGDFIDMYPDRSLFSFKPKYNKYRNRQEKNWNYCITYPSSSTTDGFDEFIERNNNSLKAIYFDENTRADNGVKQLVIYSITKHGLQQGDYVNIYNTVNGETVKIIDNAEVAEIADEYIFTVFNADVQISKTWVEFTGDIPPSILTVDGKEYKLSSNGKKYELVADGTVKYYYILSEKSYVNFDDDAQQISYKKVVNDIECDYYVRIFSKLPNFKNASADTSSEYQIYKNDGELIKEYQDRKYDFESHASRLAFAKNVYSDEIGEVVFTDDIIISNLKDNLGRPLSTIYFTITKNNKGYKEWYGYNAENWDESDISASTVEYSHCFGEVKCGIETSIESSANNELNSIHNISVLNRPDGFNVEKINGKRTYTIDNGKEVNIGVNEIWFDYDKNYYGDLCYYDNYNAIEMSIQPILHRVNTAQRESFNSKSQSYYSSYVYDEISFDDYDKTTNSSYIVEAYGVDSANKNGEGYYYNPHYEIKIKTFDKLRTAMPDFLNMTSLTNTSDGVRITTLERHFLTIGDKAVIYNNEDNKYYYCTTISGKSDNDRTFTCSISEENGNIVTLNDLNQSYPLTYNDEGYDYNKDIFNFKLFKIDNLDIPSYAKILRDGTCRLIWRDIVNNGFNETDKSVEEYPFTNGAFYINKHIDIYMRRQDPYGTYGLFSKGDILGKDVIYENEDNYTKEKDISC